MREVKYQALVVKTRLDNLGSKMDMAGVSEYEVLIDVRDLSLENGKVDYVIDSEGDEYSYFDGSLKAIRQYVGLKDRNKRDIYEQDIVDVWRLGAKGRFEVRYREEGVPMYILYPQPIDESGMWNLRSDMSMAIEVVGNVYENPSLLK